jgi:hypothetical protein
MDIQKRQRMAATPAEIAFITEALGPELARGVRGYAWCSTDPSFKATRQSDRYQVTVYLWQLEEFADDAFDYDVRLPTGWSVDDMEPADQVKVVVHEAPYDDKLTVRVYKRLPAGHLIRVGPAEDSNGKTDEHMTILRPDRRGDTYKLPIPLR